MKRNKNARALIVLLLAVCLMFPVGCAAPATKGGTGSNGYSRGNVQAAATQAPAANAPEAPIAADEAKGANGDTGLNPGGGYRYRDHYSPDTSGESYNDIDEIGFHSPVKSPLSTFSVDPDSAAYANIRRMLQNGSDVPKDAVEVEQMVNYFHYDYKMPDGDAPFSVNTEYSACPWDKSHKLLVVGLQAEDVAKQDLPPSNLVFLLDVSGSMQDEDKLPLVKRSFQMLATRLSIRDTVSIVTYASGVNTVLNGVNGSKKARIMDAIQDLEAGGSTAGASGLQTAYNVAANNFIEGGNNRVILATDGDFNVGPSSDADMANLIEGKRKSGVFLSVMGFGTGNLQNSKMETLASHGNGNYSYIDSIQEARKDMVRETGGTLLTVAKDVKIQVEFNPEEVKGYRLIGYENDMLASKDFNNDKVDAAEIGAGHQATAIYEIIPADSADAVTGSDLKYQATEEASSGEICTVSVRYKEPEGTNSKLLSFPVKGSIFTADPSDSFQFASAVAEFGLLLRDSKYKGNASLHQVLALAQGSSDDDLKDEFISLVQMARDGGYRYQDYDDDTGD